MVRFLRWVRSGFARSSKFRAELSPGVICLEVCGIPLAATPQRTGCRYRSPVPKCLLRKVRTGFHRFAPNLEYDSVPQQDSLRIPIGIRSGFGPGLASSFESEVNWYVIRLECRASFAWHTEEDGRCQSRTGFTQRVPLGQRSYGILGRMYSESRFKRFPIL